MSIELLWIIPIMAVAIFAFSVSYAAQKRSVSVDQGKQLSMEVREFNDGKFLTQARATEARLDEFEHTVASINKALANQQKVIEKFQEENSRYNEEIGMLKKKLGELHKENDIVVSENYSLRAKYNNLVKKTAPDAELAENNQFEIIEPEPALSKKHPTPTKFGWERGMSVLDETKPFSTNFLEDTSIIDMSDLFK